MEELVIDLNKLDNKIKCEMDETDLIIYKLNTISPFERQDIINELFKKDNIKIGPNFYCNNISNLSISNNVNIGSNFTLISYSKVNIGSNVRISSNVTIKTAQVDYNEKNIIRTSDVYIGSNAYIGSNVVILGGVRIGDNSYICDNSLVDKDVLDNEVVSGNPIKVLDIVNNKNEVSDCEFVEIYDLKNIRVLKDSNDNLYLEAKKSNDRRILAYKDTYTDVRNIDEVVFVLSDIINVIDGNIAYLDVNSYKDNIYQSSYYLGYLGVDKFNDEIYTVKTDDDDIIAVRILDGVKFKRIFYNEISDDVIKDCFNK